MDFANRATENELVMKLEAGFGALLAQIQELTRRNTDLEQRLSRFRDEVYLHFIDLGHDRML